MVVPAHEIHYILGRAKTVDVLTFQLGADSNRLLAHLAFSSSYG